MVAGYRNGESTKVDLQSGAGLEESVKATDEVIDELIKGMEAVGGGALDADRGPLLQDLAAMFEDRMMAVEREGASPERAAALKAVRDRAAVRYKQETGREWRRS